MKKILVTGLCLSRNLGGPAMGLTLVDQLRKKYGNEIEFKFAITPSSFEEEKYWANYYGLQIVRRDSAYAYYLATNPFARIAKSGWELFKALRAKTLFAKRMGKKNGWDVREVHAEFMSAYCWADMMIDMSGISYVGDGVRSASEGLNCYSSFYYAKKYGKPFARFIQSFGPFDDWKVRFFANKEFERLPFIPARGVHSAEYCRSIVRDQAKVHDFPDAAILLPVNQSWANEFSQRSGLVKKQYVVVSPSAVIYHSVSKSVGGSVGEKHGEAMVAICKSLIARGEYIVFLPHMYSKNPLECDREVARRIASELPENTYLIVEDDIDPMMAKGLIALSKYAIVSRYHALVAALSTGTDVITVGWNIKYQDIMEYYGKEKYAVDMRQYDPESLAQRVLEFAKEFDDQIDTSQNSQAFKGAQQKAEKLVMQAFNLLTEWIDAVRPVTCHK